MVNEMKNKADLVKKNWIFIIGILGLLFVYMMRFSYLEDNIVSLPDCKLVLDASNGVLEQTWQPEVKWISGVTLFYSVQENLKSDLRLTIFSDDYSEILTESILKDYEFQTGEDKKVKFDFDRVKVIPGERYRFRIAILNSNASGTVQVDASHNYGGCTIGGKDTGCGAALGITFVKFSRIFWLTAILFPIFSFTLLCMCLTRRRFEEIVALAILFEGIILYIFGMMEQLVLGLNIVYIIAIIAFGMFVFFFNKKELSMKDIISTGMILYLVFLTIIILANHGEWLAKRDDMRHWGIAVRDMYYYNSYAKHVNSTVILARYLPFAALIEWAFVYVNGAFSEDILLVAYQVMMLSVIIIFAKPLCKGNIIRRITPVLVAMVCIPIIFYNDISSFIMVDPLQMMLLAYVILCYYKDGLSKFNMVRMLCALTALTLIKDIGLVLAAMAIFIIFMDGLLEKIRERKWKAKMMIFPMTCMIIVLISYASWQVYLSIPIKAQIGQDVVHTEKTKEEIEDVAVDNAVNISGISVEGILKILQGNGEEYQYEVTKKYLTELFDGESYKFAGIKFSFVDLLLMISFCILSLVYFGYWRKNKAKMMTFAGVIVLASVGICVFLQLAYWFTFNMYEALELTSMQRYLGTYICAMLMVTFYLIYEIDNKENNKLREYIIYILSFFMIISMPVNGILVRNNDIEWYATEDVIYGHDDIADILKSVAKRGEKVQFICQGSSGYSEYIFRQKICPLVSYHTYWNIVSSEELAKSQETHTSLEGEYNTGVVISPEVYEEWLRQHEYLVLFHIDEEFIKSYGNILKSDSPLEDGSVYKILSDENGITLRLLGRTGIKEWS